MSERKMATIRQVSAIMPIPDADKICAYQIDGWMVVDRIGKYQLSELVIYCEIDSWIPSSIAPFLSKGKEPREYNGIKGERLRTARLRKCVSQGLLLKIDEYFAIENIDGKKYINISVPLNCGDTNANISDIEYNNR